MHTFADVSERVGALMFDFGSSFLGADDPNSLFILILRINLLIIDMTEL